MKELSRVLSNRGQVYDRLLISAPALGRRRGAETVALAALVVAGGVALTLAARASAPIDLPKPAPVAKGWTPVNRPFELFSLDVVGAASSATAAIGATLPVGALPASYSATRHVEGGGRRDLVGSGRIGETAALLVQFYRLGEEARPPAPLYVEAVRRAAEARFWVERAGAIDAMTTRFGPVEVADVALRRDETTQHCLAFRFADADMTGTTLRVSGLSCGEGGVAPARADLACQIDRFQLVAAGEDELLRAAFVAAERKRDDSCAPARLAGVQPALRPDWLAKSGAPDIRRVSAPERVERPAANRQASAGARRATR